MPARILFLGSPQFAVPSLEALVDDPRIDVVLAITQPDRPAGRGRRLTAPAIKDAADRLDVPILQPETLRDPEVISCWQAARPDLLVVVSYGEILRRQVLDLAPGGVLNVHPSLLPRYRGAAPVPAAILNGDRETGVSIIRLVKRLDAGPILAQSRMPVRDDETAGELSNRLADLGAQMLPDICMDWLAGRIEPREQDDELATYTREWTKDDARIDWSTDAAQIERLVRAAQPWPVAWTTFNGQPFRIHRASIVQGPRHCEPGRISRCEGRLQVATPSGSLVLEVVQPAGKRKMDAAAWWNGVQAPDAAFV